MKSDKKLIWVPKKMLKKQAPGKQDGYLLSYGNNTYKKTIFIPSKVVSFDEKANGYDIDLTEYSTLPGRKLSAVKVETHQLIKMFGTRKKPKVKNENIER